MPDQIKLLAAIDAYSASSLGGESDDGELSRQRSLSIDAYSGKMLDVPPPGRSQVNDRAVFETIQWIMPSMMRIFAGGDNVVEFDPEGEEDEDIAAQESDYLNYKVRKSGDWELTVRMWCQDALLTKNAYCLVDMEETKVPEVETYLGQSEEQLALLLEDGMEVIGQRQYDDPDDPGTLIDPMTGQPVQDEETMVGAMAIYAANGVEPEMSFKQLFDVELKRVEVQKELAFKVLPPERCRVGSDSTDFTLQHENYFEYWDYETISDIRKDGYDIPDDIADDAGTYDTQEDESRDEPLQTYTEIDSPDPAMRQVKKRNIWIRHDYDDDGIAELQRVTLIGREVIDHEPASRIPVACIVPFINTHRHHGFSVADLVFDIQRIKTSLLRSGLDSLNLANNPGHVISDKVNRDDMMVSRPGRLVRLGKGALPGEGHVMPIQTENTFPHAQQGLQHMDTVTEARVGVNRMFQGIDASNVNDHNRVGQLSTMAAQRIEDIARLFGTGFKRLFSIAHELLIKAGPKAETIKLRGQWTPIDPTQWRTGRDMTVTAPFAAGNKDSLVQRIMLHMSVHEKALAGGLPIVDAQDSYELALELAKATDLQGTKIYTDPKTIPPKEPGPDYTMMAIEVENKKAENEAIDEERKAEIESVRITTTAEVDKYKADLQSQTQIALAQIKEGQAINLENLKAQLKDAPLELGQAFHATSEIARQAQETMQALEASMKELMDATNAPIDVVRENGKIVGKRVNGRLIPIREAT